MDIKYNELIQLIEKYTQWESDDAKPSEALYINLCDNNSPKKEGGRTITYESDNATLVLDINEDDEVVGIEFV